MRDSQVITNLVGNAIKFTPKGSVACSCKLVNVGKDENGEDAVWLEFCVADTGIGIKVRLPQVRRLADRSLIISII